VEHKDVKILVTTLPECDPKVLRGMIDQTKDKLHSAVVCIATINDGRISIAAGVTKDLVHKVKAGDLVNYVAMHVGGKGGGRPDFAQAGGTDIQALPAALEEAKAWIESCL